MRRYATLMLLCGVLWLLLAAPPGLAQGVSSVMIGEAEVTLINITTGETITITPPLENEAAEYAFDMEMDLPEDSTFPECGNGCIIAEGLTLYFSPHMGARVDYGPNWRIDEEKSVPEEPEAP